MKCVLIFSTTFVSNVSHSKKNVERYNKKCVLVSIQSNRYSCPILMKIEVSRQIFEKFSNLKFHANPSSRIRVFPCGVTDRQTDKHDE